MSRTRTVNGPNWRQDEVVDRMRARARLCFFCGLCVLLAAVFFAEGVHTMLRPLLTALQAVPHR
jgi:hypothetical protein